MKAIKRFLYFTVFMFLICCCFLFVACSGNYNTDISDKESSPGLDGYLSNDEIKINENIPSRKIIYNAQISLTVEDIKQGQTTLSQKLNSDEWIENSRINDTYATVVLRIKSSRLNDFLSSLQSMGKVENYSIESYDVSENYYDNTVKKATLETEQTTLLALLEKATSINDVLAITERLSEIDVELQSINGVLNRYDSLIDYSKVTVSMYTPTTYHEDTFWDKLVYGFSIGLEIAEGVLLFVLCVLPFGIIIGGIVLSILFVVKKCKQKKQQKNTLNEKNNDDKLG